MHCPSLSGWSMRWRWCKGTKGHKRWREMDLVQPTIWCRQGNITRQGSTQTGGINTNYGGRLIPRLWTSKELLRWKKNWMRTSEEGGGQFTPSFYYWPWTSGAETAGRVCREISFSPYFNTTSRHCVLKFMNYPSSVQVPWTLQWIKLGNVHFFLLSGLEPVCLQAEQRANKPRRWAKERNRDETF